MLDTGSFQARVAATSASTTTPAVISATDRIRKIRCTAAMIADARVGAWPARRARLPPYDGERESREAVPARDAHPRMSAPSSAERTASYQADPERVGRVLLLYSGGLDTSVMLRWIQEHYDAEIVTLTVDLGQPDEDWEVIDGNLWGRSSEGGPIEDLDHPPRDDVFRLVTRPEEAPDDPELVRLGFVRGCPISLDGEQLGLVELLERVAAVGRRHGVGIVDHIEDRVVGLKVRDIYEVPAAAIVLAAHRELEKLVS